LQQARKPRFFDHLEGTGAEHFPFV
jgi:hypothetical protein